MKCSTKEDCACAVCAFRRTRGVTKVAAGVKGAAAYDTQASEPRRERAGRAYLYDTAVRYGGDGE